jgi:hypothetical protein
MNQPRLTIKVTTPENAAEDREIFMSFGLLNSLVRVLGDPSRTAAFDLDPDLAEQVILLTLIPRSATGKPIGKFEEFECPGLDPEEAFKLFDWVKGHVLDFFVRRLRGTIDQIVERKDDLGNLGSSMSGLGA